MAFAAQPTISDQKLGTSCSFPIRIYSQQLGMGANSKVSEQHPFMHLRAELLGQQAVRILMAKPDGNDTIRLCPRAVSSQALVVAASLPDSACSLLAINSPFGKLYICLDVLLTPCNDSYTHPPLQSILLTSFPPLFLKAS